MLSAKPHWPTNAAPEKLLPFPWGPAFLGAGRNLSLFRSHLFSSRVSPSTQQGMVLRGVYRDSCNRDVMGMGRKGGRTCRASQGKRRGEGRRKLLGEAERGEQEPAAQQLHFTNEDCRPPPPHSWAVAGLLPHGAVANEASAPLDSLHLLPLASSCQAPGSRRAGLAFPRSQVRPTADTCAAPGIPGAGSRHATRREITLPREGRHPETPGK